MLYVLKNFYVPFENLIKWSILKEEIVYIQKGWSLRAYLHDSYKISLRYNEKEINVFEGKSLEAISYEAECMMLYAEKCWNNSKELLMETN